MKVLLTLLLSIFVRPYEASVTAMAAAHCTSNGNDYRSPAQIGAHENFASKMQNMEVPKMHYNPSMQAGYFGTQNFDGSIRQMDKYCSGPPPGHPGTWTCN